MSCVQYVVFSLGKEEYGIEISIAQEIIRIPQQITKMPNLPSYIEGVVNLRGNVIPVIDLKKRFGFERTERGTDSRLLILNLEDRQVGTIVDNVSEVIKIDDDSVETLDSELSGIGSNNISGIGKIDERLILLLDTTKIKADVF
jgi:purine-binding chemotaxis protein CheW